LRALAQAGVRACALDKADFPRHKPCGGGISIRTVAELDFEWKDLVEAAPRTIEFALRDLYPVRKESEAPFLLVMRSEFDARLLERAIEAGGRFYPHHLVQGVEVDENGVVVQTDRGLFHAPVVIGADGAKGCVARSIGLHSRAHGIALDAEIEAPPEVVAEYQDSVYFSFADPPWGYSWISPKRRTLSAGVGKVTQRIGSLKETLNRFLQGKKLSGYPMRLFGHPVPLWSGQQRHAAPRALLVGDAAGLVDPLMGEGIAYAVKSGKIAAHHVTRALESGDFSFEGYSVDINAGIGLELTRAGDFAHRFYTFPRIFHLYQLGMMGVDTWDASQQSTGKVVQR